MAAPRAARRGASALLPVFAYGSLMNGEVLKIVLNRAEAPPLRDAVLHGYRRFKLANRPYPTIVESAGGRVAGKLFDVTPREMEAVDFFEDDYEAREAAVEVAASGERERGGGGGGAKSVRAKFYMLRPEHHAHIVREEWDYQRFLEGLDHYLRTTCDDMARAFWPKK